MDNSIISVKMQCKKHSHALASFHAAKEALAALLQLEINGNEVVRSALHHSSVIHYARPFTETRSPGGRTRYSDKHFRGAHGFDPKVHKYLLGLRDKLIAHGDTIVIEPQIVYQWARIQFESEDHTRESQRILKSAATSYGILFTLDDSGVIEQFKEHVEAVCTHTFEQLSKALVELYRLSATFPEESFNGGKLVGSEKIKMEKSAEGNLSAKVKKISEHPTSEVSFPVELEPYSNSYVLRRMVCELYSNDSKLEVVAREFKEFNKNETSIS